jgi:cytochrome c biogenesis protein CcmG/thiol:disulfide interchange protein DsbE
VDEVRIFFVVLSAPRFSALVGIGVFLLAAELLGRKRDELSAWAWNSILLVVAGARAGFVLENLNVFAAHPLSILFFWQGGFSPLWGIAAAAIYTLWHGRKRLRLQLAAAGLAAWGVTTLLVTPTSPKTVTLPAITLTTWAGTHLELGSLQGEPLVINLWATWCGPCRREMPMLTDVAAQSQISFVLAEQASSTAQIEAFLGDNSLDSQNVYLDKSRALAQHFGATGLPTTLFFNGDGTLVYRHVGEISRALVLRELRGLE